MQNAVLTFFLLCSLGVGAQFPMQAHVWDGNGLPNKYGLSIITSLDELQSTIDADSNKSFVPLADYVPSAILDIKYGTTQNIFYEQLYDTVYALFRLPVAKALAAAQEEFKQYGVGIKVYDAYRPYSVTCYMFQRVPDTIYMGKPWRGSKHNRGVAVDMTLIDAVTGKELAMPTPFDCLTYPSHPDYTALPDSVLKNRDLLISIMQKHGFKVAKNEWWHYDFITGAAYELLDISQKELQAFVDKKRRKSK